MRAEWARLRHPRVDGLRRLASSAAEELLPRRRRYLVACESIGARSLFDEVCYQCRHYDADVVVGTVFEQAEPLVRELRSAGISARGWRLGDDLLMSVAAAVEEFDADAVIIATEPHGRSSWIDRRLVPRARSVLSIPVAHVVVDLEYEADSPQLPEGYKI